MARVADPDLTERRRRQIMDAALVCFRRRGFHQSSMQEICTESRLSAGAIYRYFPSKTDIIAAIIEGDHENRHTVFDGVRDAADFIERMVSMAEGFVGKILSRGGAPIMGDIFAEAMRNPDVAARLRAGVAPFQERLTEVISILQARGEFDASLDPDQAARIVFGGVDGLCMRVVMHAAEERAHIDDDVRELLRRVLLPAPPAPRALKKRRETVE